MDEIGNSLDSASEWILLSALGLYTASISDIPVNLIHIVRIKVEVGKEVVRSTNRQLITANLLLDRLINGPE